MNPNTPVIIGISQLQQRTTDPQVSDEPVDMMINAVRAAAADAGNEKMLAKEEPMASEAEMARGIRAAIQVYPIIENAIRYQAGETIDQHLIRISELWAGFSRVAVNNPGAWIREPVDAQTIRTVSMTNRMVSFPYPQLMNSNNAVDMASALIMCSVEKAKSLQIPSSKWVYPWCGTDAHDHYLLSARDNLYSSPAIRLAGRSRCDAFEAVAGGL
ncbi:MAG: hypothetical protein IIB71_08950 [Proteobacteria bacterium]|nr:hypothetical protein [Pseudomonadota bacterium]